MNIIELNKIYKKYINTTKQEIIELIINLYLLYSNYRNIFQIDLQQENDKLLNQIKKIITAVESDYIIHLFRKNNGNGVRIIVYNKDKFDINKLDTTFGKKYAKQLGEFYTCASDNFSKFDCQICISI
jgi:hypothetical protein